MLLDTISTSNRNDESRARLVGLSVSRAAFLGELSMELTVVQIIDTVLVDVDPIHLAELPIRVIVTPLGMSLYADGHGDFGSAEDHGAPVFIELRNGNLRLVVWGDINKENPTHTIDLSGAREDRRRVSGK